MSAIRVEINDPTLFLFTSFACHPALDDPAAAPKRRRRAHQVFERVHWIPKEALDKALQPDREVEHRLVRHWQHPAGDPRLSDNWAVTTFGISYHETLGVLLGVEQSGPYTRSLADWLTHAHTCWTSTFGTNGRWPPDVCQDGVVVGRAWVWTGEWSAPPAEGWEHFGRDEYPDGCVVFPWGLLGYRAAANDGLRQFDLHVARRDEDPKKRDIFLLTALIVILSDFVKVMDYLWWRYKTSAHAQLLEDERQIMMQKPYDPGLTRLQELLDLGNEVTSEQLHRLNKIIFPLTRRLGDLKHDCLTVNIARDAIHRQLEAHWGRILRGAYGTHFVADVEWVAEQMASDIAYFDTATQCGTAIMSALKIKAEVENTHAQHLLRVANLFIASLAIGISSTVGAWTIAHSITSVYASKVVTILDVVTILVPAVISLLVGWLIGYSCWRRWRFGRPGGYAAMRKWVTYDLARSIETPTNPQESHTRVPHTPGGTAPGQG